MRGTGAASQVSKAAGTILRPFGPPAGHTFSFPIPVPAAPPPLGAAVRDTAPARLLGQNQPSLGAIAMGATSVAADRL